jgi:hypothetical protein
MEGMQAASDHLDPNPGWRASGLDQEPPRGAHLTTSRRGYSHHGVYVGRGRVVHYSGLSAFWHCGPVEEVSLSRFVDHPKSQYSPEKIVRRARVWARTIIGC